MSRGVNKVILLGHLGREPETKQFDNGNKLVQVSLATTENWKDKNSGELRTQTEWHRLVFSHRLADIAQQYLYKGMQIYIEGKVATRKWKNQLGLEQYTTEIKVSNMQMLTRKEESKYSSPQPSAEAVMKMPDAPPQEFVEFDDDIPF
ncbi:single-stranded DNA-binding protein [Vibrio breoganii]